MPGYITGFAEQALVDSKNPKAKPLPIAKMMVHHFLYFAPGRVDEAPGGCWSGAGFIGGRGEEHPTGGPLHGTNAAFRAKYGIRNENRDGKAPGWSLTAMVMNHYKKPKDFYVRTRVYYTTEKRTSVQPLVIGKCSQLVERHVLRRARRRQEGLELRGQERLGRAVQRPDADGVLAPARRRASTTRSRASPASAGCSRRPSTTPPRTTSTTRSARSCTSRGRSAPARTPATQGIPIAKGEVLRRTAVHDNHNLHVASMGFWATWFVKDDSVKKCGKLPEGHRRDQQAEALRPHARLRPRGASAVQAPGRVQRVRRRRARRWATTSSGPAGSPRRSASRSPGGSGGRSRTR